MTAPATFATEPPSRRKSSAFLGWAFIALWVVALVLIRAVRAERPAAFRSSYPLFPAGRPFFSSRVQIRLAFARRTRQIIIQRRTPDGEVVSEYAITMGAVPIAAPGIGVGTSFIIGHALEEQEERLQKRSRSWKPVSYFERWSRSKADEIRAMAAA